jgi:glycosyltransferase involved in cell wall biosynthesis
MTTLPLVSIVTPSFNQARFLEATIQSVLAQDYPNLEYIVVDGGSKDGSVEILRRYESRLAYWCSEPDTGQTEAVNKGFARARGQVQAWLNSDDVYRPGAVAQAVEFLVSHPEVGMVYGQADYIDASGATIGRFPAAPTDLRRLRRGYVHIPQQAAFFRASLWRLVAPLDPSFYFAMDYDLWVRIASLSPIRHVPRVWAGFRLHDDAKTLAAAARCWPEMWRVHRRDGGRVLSVLGAKYALRRLVEPLMPLRLRWRVWRGQKARVR